MLSSFPGAKAKCQPGDYGAFYSNGNEVHVYSESTTGRDVTMDFPTPSDIIAIGCCRKELSHRPFGIIFSSAATEPHVLVTDHDWKCLQSGVIRPDVYTTLYNNSAWEDAYVIQSNVDAEDGFPLQFSKEEAFEPYAKWIWARRPDGQVPDVNDTGSLNCAFCRAVHLAKFKDQPVQRGTRRY